MKIPAFTIFILLISLTASANAQLKSMIASEADTITHLTPEMFFNSSPFHNSYQTNSLVKSKQANGSIFDNTLTKYALLFGRSAIANKNDLIFRGSLAPQTVSEYNRQVRQKIFMAEPTFLERRSLPLYNW